MNTDALIKRATFLVMLAATMLVVGGPAMAGDSKPFPCRWNWSLLDGYRPGYVTAGNNADCGGRRGSLTLGVRLLKLDPVTKAWHTDKKKTRTFRILNKSRYLEIAEHCEAATFRGVFRWTLRNTSGAVVARHTVRSSSLVVKSPDCKITLG
jgi:hypothetical protein